MFLIINFSSYYLTKTNTDNIVKIILQEKLNILSTHYGILLETQKRISNFSYNSTIQKDRFLEILSEANSASEPKKAELRKELHLLLAPLYKTYQEAGILQYHFIFPDNTVFYRAHKPDKFGDNLTDIRLDFKYANENKKIFRGFAQGRTAHAFRNTFPLFDKNNKHIGAMEVSFSSDSFEWYLNKISGIHSHFIVNKKIFNAKTWKRDDLILEYTQSAEHEEYMLSVGYFHTKAICIDENANKLRPIRAEINSGISLGKAFSLYVSHRNHIDVTSFFPINDIGQKTVAWIVSYEESPVIESTFKNAFIVRVASFLLSLLLLYFIVKQIYANADINKKNQLLNEILNSTDNLMFITDFRDVKFSNDKFKECMHVKNSNLFNQSSDYDMLDIFVSVDGYLHKGLLKKNEDFVSLISRTAPENRIISLLDKHFEPKAFKISISKNQDSNDYLVSLSDITEIKEQQMLAIKQAYTDGLTQVYNRRKFDEIFELEFKSVQRYKNPLSVAILDIDKFKDFNDNYGHLIGDEVLIMMAQMLNKNVRETDIFARWGGEEFVILFKNTTVDVAHEIANKLKDKIQNNQHPTAGTITASFGLTEYKEGDTEESIFKRCDKALYLAKSNGRNRVDVL